MDDDDESTEMTPDEALQLIRGEVPFSAITVHPFGLFWVVHDLKVTKCGVTFGILKKIGRLLRIQAGRFNKEDAMWCGSAPEAIMEPTVVESLRVYLEEGCGCTDTAMDALVSGYRAYAQSVNIMSDWLVALGDVPPEDITQVAPVKKSKRGRRGAKQPAKKVGEEKAKEEEKWQYGTKTFPEAAKTVENTLATLIVKRFSPDIADTIFEDGGVIEWLPELINHRRWRTLLYELMDQYPNCLMLNFAVKLISDAGFQTEISTVTSAAQQLDIFSRVLLTSVDAVLYEHRKGCLTAAYEKAFGELVRVVCQAEHTYVYTMGLLKAIGSAESGRILAASEQIAESLRAEMEGREHETTAIRTALAQTADDQVASHFTQALLNMVSRCELNPADMTIIYDQYILPLPPPISIIRDPIFIELLLDSLFHYEGPKQSRLELDNCRQCLDDTISLLEGMDDLLLELNELLHAIKMPVVAAGVLYYVQTLLLSEQKTGDPPGAALCLLDHISTLHPNLHAKAFDVCCQLYEKIASENEAAEVIMERQRLVVDRLVHLLSVGGAIPVLEKVCEMFRNGQIDASLVRYFSMEVLEIIAPPFANDVITLFLPLVIDEEIFDKAAQRKLHRRFLLHKGFDKESSVPEWLILDSLVGEMNSLAG
uniref:SCD domain-containing protein n=1 Tax=Angiostrongylus cantonensis TaxID=6313 RepID=A0A158P8I8_ANGCA